MIHKNNFFQFLTGLLVIAILIVIIIYFNKAFESPNKSNKRYCIAEKEKLLRGIIVRKYYSRRLLFVLNDSSVFPPQCSRISQSLSIGDSIYKPSGTFDCYIYKMANPDSVIFIKCDFDCDLYDKEK